MRSRIQPRIDPTKAKSNIPCLSGCLTRCEEQTLWKAGRREKCAGNDPFLPSCLPNLLCVKQPDMQAILDGLCKIHRKEVSRKGAKMAALLCAFASLRDTKMPRRSKLRIISTKQVGF
jgi:hypothetical protein